MALVRDLDNARHAFQEWRDRGVVLSPRVVARRSDAGDLSGASFPVDTTELPTTEEEHDVQWDAMVEQRGPEVLQRLRRGILRGNEATTMKDADVGKALKKLANAYKRFESAETARRNAAKKMQDRSEKIAKKFDECAAIATFDGKKVPEVRKLQEKEQRLEAELRQVQSEIDAFQTNENDNPQMLFPNKKGEQLAALVETLGGARVVYCRSAEKLLEIQIELSEATMSLALDEISQTLTSAHLNHPIIHITDILDAARREKAPDDVRFVVREAQARLRRLLTRRTFVSTLHLPFADIHVDDLVLRLTFVARPWTALLTLPANFPDHPPGATPRLETLSVFSRHANVNDLRRHADLRLRQNVPISVVLTDLHAALSSSSSSSQKNLPSNSGLHLGPSSSSDDVSHGLL